MHGTFASRFYRLKPNEEEQVTYSLNYFIADKSQYTEWKFWTKLHVKKDFLLHPCWKKWQTKPLRIWFIFLIGIHSIQGRKATTRHDQGLKKGSKFESTVLHTRFCNLPSIYKQKLRATAQTLQYYFIQGRMVDLYR